MTMLSQARIWLALGLLSFGYSASGWSQSLDPLFERPSDITADDYSGCAGTTPSRIVDADPDNFRNLLSSLQPGDVMRLAPGNYTRSLRINGLRGAPGNCITIEGPSSGPPARFLGNGCCNTVSLTDAAYLIIRRLELDGQNIAGLEAVKAENPGDFAHHITLEYLTIVNYGATRSTVGISSKSPAWNWVIRHNFIAGAGTGMYLGNSNGEEEFVNGLIEYNVILDTVGYNAQIKYQNRRSQGLSDGTMPNVGRTIIRHNVFSKANNASLGSAGRPNLLVGKWPDSGPGSDDEYLIYGNFFYQNQADNEALFQGTGNVIFYNNVMRNDYAGGAVRLQFHDGGSPQRIRVFNNTMVSGGRGVSLTGEDTTYQQLVFGNAIFADTPIYSVDNAFDNLTDSYDAAEAYLLDPFAVAAAASGPDLSPLSGALQGPALDLNLIDASYVDAFRDFDDRARDFDTRGAYADGGTAPPPANGAPTVTLTAPVDGTTVSQGEVVAVTATADDSDGQVVEVAFYADGVLLEADTSAPFETSYTAARLGPVSLSAVALDDAGDSSAPSSVTLTVEAAAPPPPPPGPGAEVIIDNEDSAFSTVGHWPTFSTASNYGTSYQIHNPQNSANPDTATWDLAGVSPGLYEVYVQWVVSGGRSPAAPYTVHHAAGSTTIEVDQRVNGGSWQLLGSFELDANSRVVLRAVPSGKVAADAVRVVS
ncbi:MAG: Ig-like domain-containing protein, partial [Candidatus Competibacterales bacterium]